MRTIENDLLRVQISDHGAELSAVFDKTHGRDILWTADPAVWNRHAPILFPFVGRVYGNVYRYKGKEYPMGQHGFARDMDFTCVDEKPDTVTHRLCSTDETRAVYPFDFTLTVTHRLEKNSLFVEWTVENPGDETLYFSIGGHPGFLCPVLPGTKQTDYFLSFPGHKKLTCKSVDVATGTIQNDRQFTLETPNGCVAVTEHTFDHDALVFDDNQVKTVGILYPDKTPYITLHCPDFPSLGVWSKPNNTAPFICLEPWTGRCDNTGFSGELPEKYGIQTLSPHEAFHRGYEIVIE